MEQIVHYKESSQSSHPYQLQQTKFYNRISPIFEIRKKQKRTKFVSRDLFAALFSAKCLASETSAKVSEIEEKIVVTILNSNYYYKFQWIRFYTSELPSYSF